MSRTFVSPYQRSCNLLYSTFTPVFILLAVSVFVLFMVGCESETDEERFSFVPPSRSGIDFQNNLEESPELNILNYLYFYNGAGVAAGDINNDGRTDLYFTANMGRNRLYLNRGMFNFEEVTDSAGVAGHENGWSSGATMADINGDGWLDIYVSQVNYRNREGRNQLFINNRDGTFTDRAEEYGLDFEGYSVQAAFFDFDNDQDLDMYLLNHSIHSRGSFTDVVTRSVRDQKAGDRLYRNDEGSFTDISEQAGIYSSQLGYGLGVVASDINMDGCIDLYVSNDFHENDYLYINQCDGTFNEVLQNATGHTSRASMGIDVADFNNDLRPDVMVLDMLPDDEKRLKSSVSTERFEIYDAQRSFGYQPQLIRNTLQLNLGRVQEIPVLFSEIGQLAGVEATDWSWAPLFFDMDHDGNKDLLVTNGIYRRPNDYDYLVFSGQKQVQESLRKGITESNLKLVERMPHVKVPNVAFGNSGSYAFADSSDAWGVDVPGYSNGAAYADFDNDGDLDFAVNNVNSESFLFRNRTSDRGSAGYLKIRLQGSGGNTSGIGAKVILYTDDQKILLEQSPTRGFQSSVSHTLHTGLGNAGSVDSALVIWPGGAYQTLTDLPANQTLTVEQKNASGSFDYGRLTFDTGKRKLFRDVTQDVDLDFIHNEDAYDDFSNQRDLPRRLSTEGPAVATADVNGDGYVDFYLTGARSQSGVLYLQQSDGSFSRGSSRAFIQEADCEGVNALFLDVDGDGDQDLYEVCAGNNQVGNARELRDRLYLNDGSGTFVRNPEALPRIYQIGSVVATTDYDGDGDLDLFVGGRAVARHYGVDPRSYLLENDGMGNFRDVTGQVAPQLSEAGMVTDAAWSDLDGNGSEDLVLLGEWMPVTVFMNRNEQLEPSADDNGLKSTGGWWNRLAMVDLDGDGDDDFIAGNWGRNAMMHPAGDRPAYLYLHDFDENGQVDPLIAYTKNGKIYPAASRDEMLTQIPSLRERFKTYRDYAGKTVQELFGAQIIEEARVKTVHTFDSMILENRGDGTFRTHSLPAEVQFAPVLGILPHDYDGNGTVDLALGGNFYGVRPAFGGRHDASYGWYLEGDGAGGFKVQKIQESGFFVRGQVRDMAILPNPAGDDRLLIARNNSAPHFVQFDTAQ
ncbi:MAG: VCBS repeat-containing protein [Balneolaceae bacterium]|nr:VCBS repeat-containing protein [Balneolaceae bacterium]